MKLPYDPVCWSVRWSIGPSVAGPSVCHNFLKVHQVSIPMILLEHFLALHIEGYSSHLTGYTYYLIQEYKKDITVISILNIIKNPLLNLAFEHIALHSFIMP